MGKNENPINKKKTALYKVEINSSTVWKRKAVVVFILLSLWWNWWKRQNIFWVWLIRCHQYMAKSIINIVIANLIQNGKMNCCKNPILFFSIADNNSIISTEGKNRMARFTTPINKLRPSFFLSLYLTSAGNKCSAAYCNNNTAKRIIDCHRYSGICSR